MHSPRIPSSRSRRSALTISATIAALLALTAGLSGCGSASASSGSGSELRLGFLANATHASALVGLQEGLYAKDLGSTKLVTQTFNAGNAAVEAILGGSLDASFLGPNPAINAFVKSHGDAIRIIAGATSGGAELVVQPNITSAAQLKGTTLATPQLANTQDVALRYWLKQQGIATSTTGGGDLTIAPTDNATTLDLFKEKKISGAWVPEPWASRLVLEGGGKVLVDEKTLWPQGQFSTTLLAVSTKYLNAHPTVVNGLLEGLVATNTFINANPAQAKTDVQTQLKALTGKALAQDVIDRAWSEMTITNDPIASSLQTDLDHAVAVGVTQNASLNGIVDLAPLNAILAAQNKPAISAAGLGTQ
jgi:NitT/TauT family transport system substrate-binding protein